MAVPSYLVAMNAVGPVAISIGWPLVGVFVVCVALAMAEVCWVHPTARRAPVTVVVVPLFSTATWFGGGRTQFRREAPERHDTLAAAGVFG